MGARLDEDAAAVVQDAARGGPEEHGLPQVAVPVLGGHLGRVDPLAGDRGVDRDLGGAWLDRGEQAEQPVADRLDLRGVRRVVHGDPAGALLGGEQFLQDGRLAGDDRGARAVHGGDRQAVRERHLVRGERHRDHAATAREVEQSPAAQGDHTRAVLQGQRARHAGGGDLALAVPDDGRGLDAAGAPEPGQGDHDRPQRGLDDVDAVEVPPLAQDVEQRPVHEGGQRGGALAEPLGERRRGIDEVDGHPGPLRALPGEDERDLRGVGGRRAGDEVRRGPALGETVEGLQVPGRVVRDDRRAMFERGAADGEGESHVAGLMTMSARALARGLDRAPAQGPVRAPAQGPVRRLVQALAQGTGHVPGQGLAYTLVRAPAQGLGRAPARRLVRVLVQALAQGTGGVAARLPARLPVRVVGRGSVRMLGQVVA